MSEVAERVLLKGWIDRKGGSLMNPWMKRFVVLTTCKVEVYKDDHCNGLKTRIIIDNTARIVVLSAPSVASTSSTSSSSSTIASSNPFTMLKSSSNSFQSSSYRFCLQTSTEILELSADTLELRNEWLGCLAGVVGRKSELGHFISTVRTEADYRLVRVWEASVLSQSISECNGLETTIPTMTSTPTVAAPVLVSTHSASSSYAGFLPFDKWEERFEPETVRLRLERERGGSYCTYLAVTDMSVEMDVIDMFVGGVVTMTWMNS